MPEPVGDEGVARDQRGGRDATPGGRPGTTFLNYDKDIIRVIIGVEINALIYAKKNYKLLKEGKHGEAYEESSSWI